MRKTRCFCKIRSVAGHIGSTCYDQRFCIGLNQLIPVIILQPSTLIHACKTELQALFPQPVERPQNRVMLTYRCDDMIARCKKGPPNAMFKASVAFAAKAIQDGSGAWRSFAIAHRAA